MSVAAGGSRSALLLGSAFDANGGNDPVSNLEVHADRERVHGYNVIGKFLRANDGRNPKVPDLDKIVPLPPAKLLAWDATFQWQNDQDDVNEMARARHLDPATGLLLPGSTAPHG